MHVSVSNYLTVFNNTFKTKKCNYLILQSCRRTWLQSLLDGEIVAALYF